jgi:hypothetical protein
MIAVGLLVVGVISMTLSDYQVGVHLWQWVREHWLNAVAITAMATVATACVPALLSYKERRRVEQVRSEEAQGHDDLRKLMLRRVRSNWISGVLKPSLVNVFQLSIGLQLRPDLVLPAHNLRERLSGQIPSEKGVFEVFGDDADRLMLIIGDPGAGKTTLMLQLTEKLLAVAEDDSDSPIPVVANLASWSPLCKPLTAWLGDELFESYHVPREIAEEWIENDSLALFLDGFDEVAHAQQGACAAAINDYIRYHGFVPIVVCSRRAAIEKVGPLLGLETAVELMPPSDAQIDECLSLLHRDGAPVGDIQSALRADSAFRDIVRSPMMLHVIAIAYRGQQKRTWERPGNAKERERRLWAKYIDRMFSRPEKKSTRGYERKQAINYLAWLATNLLLRAHTEFLPSMLTPDWLSDPRHKYSPFRSSWSIRLIRSLDSTFEEMLTDPDIRALRRNDTYNMSHYLTTVAKIGAVITAISAGVMAGMAAGFLVGLATAPITGALILLIVIAFGTVYIELTRKGIFPFASRERHPAIEGPRRWMRYGTVVALIAFLFFGFLTGIVFGLWLGADFGVAYGLSIGLWFGLSFGLVSGWLRTLQYCAVRLFLVHAQVVPWRYEAFLRSMADKLLLVYNGKCYMFIHNMLRDYLAHLNERDEISGRAAKYIWQLSDKFTTHRH